RVWRTVAVVGDVVAPGVGKLVLRMKTRYLQNAFQLQILKQRIGKIQEIVVVRKVAEHLRVNQQRGFALRRVGITQVQKLALQIFKQRGFIVGRADYIADAVVGMLGLCEGAKVQSDHGTFEPAAGFQKD